MTGTLIAAGIAAGASAGAAKMASNAAERSARTQSAAGERAAATQSSSAERVAQTQTDAANRAADIAAQSSREALDFSRANSQLSLDQYNQQQRRLMPYRNLGNFALGQPFETEHSDLQLPSMGQSGSAPTSDTSQEESWFRSLVQGDSLSPQQLEALEPALKEKGFSLARNAAGVAGKIKLPSGEIVDVIQGASSGMNRLQWLRGPGGSAAGTTPARKPVTANVAQPVAYAPQSPLSPALQPFTYDYQPLNLIGMGGRHV